MTKTALLVILFTLTLCLSGFAQTDLLKSDLENSFKNANVVRLNKTDAIRRAKASQTLSISTPNKNFELSLTPRDLRSSRYLAEDETENGRRRLAKPEVTTYTGTVAGETESNVRLTIDESGVVGFFGSDRERYFIEPAKKYSKYAGTDEFVVYQAKDVLMNKTFNCPEDLTKEIADGKEMVLSQNTPENITGTRTLEMATDADREFVNSVAGAATANSKILSTLNMVEGFYHTEFNLTLSIVYQHTWSTADTFETATPVVRPDRNCNAALPASKVLCNIQDWWESNVPTTQVPRDVTHLFSYKASLQGMGYAYVGVMCLKPSFAYGFSGRLPLEWNWEAMNVMITTHELGHNLGAVHPQDVSPAPADCNGYLMDRQLDGNTQFAMCGYSKTQVNSFVSSNNGCMTARSANFFDFDGDGKTDVGIFRPSAGEWWINKSSTGQTSAAQFGSGTDKFVSGDFTGDGKADIAVFRPSNGNWYILRSEDGSFFSFPFGTNGDIPVPADFDGDGKADPAVFRPSAGTWYINRSTGGTAIGQFGQNGDVPVVADYDGDSKADIAIWRPSAGEWWIQRSSTGAVVAAAFGNSADKPVQGDYSGDGKADIAIWRPASGYWFILRSEDSSFYSVPFGTTGDVPAPGDFDGDGKFDTAVFRPSAGTWYINRSTAGVAILPFGTTGDAPVSSAFIP